MSKFKQLSGYQTFTVIWFGQLASLLGTALTRFALLIWAYQQTGQATTLALLTQLGNKNARITAVDNAPAMLQKALFRHFLSTADQFLTALLNFNC